MTVEVVYETHSLTEDVERGRATGWLPGRLPERGRALAAELGGGCWSSASCRRGWALERRGRGAALPLPSMDWREGWTYTIGRARPTSTA